MLSSIFFSQIIYSILSIASSNDWCGLGHPLTPPLHLVMDKIAH